MEADTLISPTASTSGGPTSPTISAAARQAVMAAAARQRDGTTVTTVAPGTRRMPPHVRTATGGSGAGSSSTAAVSSHHPQGSGGSLSGLSAASATAAAAARDPRFRRRTPPKAGAVSGTAGAGDVSPAAVSATAGADAKLKSRLSPPGAGTATGAASPRLPLLPLTERRSQEDGLAGGAAAGSGGVGLRSRRGVDGSGSSGLTWDITPDGSSAGREGRQFTVANVGNNGRLYLRPSVRPANQRYPQPHFVFPMTPPGTAGLEATAPLGPSGPTVDDNGSELFSSELDSSPFAIRRKLTTNSKLPANTGVAQSGNHRRAVSDSTVRESSAVRDTDAGAFKVVITKPGEEPRSKTTEDLEKVATPPLLQISIPSWRLGTPRFTSRGTPVFRGSSYAPTDEVRSREGTASPFNKSNRDFNATRPESPSSKKPSPVPFNRLQLPDVDESGALFGYAPGAGPRLPSFFRTTYLSTHLVIEPAMFDRLTFKPECDDRSIVRYSPTTNVVTAATPPRLVAEITSPTFLDYELISDFFLTYRAFLEPSDLLRMLIARLRWALARDDETGMVVRVRTFVALRHWILNYFVDDFFVDYGLRVTFCNLLNDFVDELSQDQRGRKVQLKILAELKKCWRRACGCYWDGPEFDVSLNAYIPIAPGGIAGSRKPSLDPSYWPSNADEDRRQADAMLAQREAAGETGFYADGTRAGQVEPGIARTGHIDSIVLGERPQTPEKAVASEAGERRQTSPISIISLDVMSCSFPSKAMRLAQGAALGAHPVAASSVYAASSTTGGPVATTPRALTGKRVRPSPSHKRTASLTDSLREQERASCKDTELVTTVPYAGSLVRGNVLPPGHAFVEVLPPGRDGSVRQTTVLSPPPVLEPPREKQQASAMSGQGMKRLIGSVRRALSTRGGHNQGNGGVSPTQGSFNMAPIGPRGATTNRLPGTAVVPQARSMGTLNGSRPPVRIDVLGARVLEDFKKAVREDQAAVDDQFVATGVAATGETLENSDVHMNGSMATFEAAADGRLDVHRPSSDMAITNGSKSIVIVDDTAPFDFPVMAGALQGASSEADAFGESYLAAAADPTPPNTPPGQAAGTPRRSSHLLGDRVLHPSISADQLPPFVPDLDTLGGPSTRPSQDADRPSLDYLRWSVDRLPPTSRTSLRHHLLRRQSDVSYGQARGQSGMSYGLARGQSGVSFGLARGQSDMSFGLARGQSDMSYGLARGQSDMSYGQARGQSDVSYGQAIRQSDMSYDEARRQSSLSHGQARQMSFQSGLARQPTVRSFDATTHSEGSIVADNDHAVDDYDDDSDGAVDGSMPRPLRALRRRPGGDLRAATNVNDLDLGSQLRRAKSAGSLTTFTESIRSSFIRTPGANAGAESSSGYGYVDVMTSGCSDDRGVATAEKTFSLGAMAEQRPVVAGGGAAPQKRDISLFSTHSSRPIMRPSFEAEAKKLAQIPDDADDDGGVESALMKLEGRYQKGAKKKTTTTPDAGGPSAVEPPLTSPAISAMGTLGGRPAASENESHTVEDGAAVKEEKREHRHLHVGPVEGTISQIHSTTTSHLTQHMATSRNMLSVPPSTIGGDVQSFLSDMSHDSVSSIPLLDRGLADDGGPAAAMAARRSKRQSRMWTKLSVLQGPDEDLEESSQMTPLPEAEPEVDMAQDKDKNKHETSSQHPSYEFVKKTGSIEQIRAGETAPPNSRVLSQTFLDDASEAASDLSSELSADVVDDGDAYVMAEAATLVRSGTVKSRTVLPGHVLSDTPPSPRGPPPSPPMTLAQALQMSPESANVPQLHDHQLWTKKPLPPTPDATPTNPAYAVPLESPRDPTGTKEALRGAPKTMAEFDVPQPKFSSHLPFILAFESEVLAQQFTLIEKDALNEIDWKELIDMRWKSSNNTSRSWVDFLRNNADARGVEVVVARFDIMVKWAVSEIVLTQDIEERARTVIKLIHVAAHCRRYRNFATMGQITIALTSQEVSRLARTWALVPAADMQTLRELEALMSPTRNFHALRAEMEGPASTIGSAGASLAANQGCIPFVGIYTHDLVFNAQRPSEIASSPTTAPLVNFERCRCAAAVVKTLLRLLEASTRYRFQPVEGITERCLWVGALADDDIRRRAESLE